jgi:hypothetical protein
MLWLFVRCVDQLLSLDWFAVVLLLLLLLLLLPSAAVL